MRKIVFLMKNDRIKEPEWNYPRLSYFNFNFLFLNSKKIQVIKKVIRG